MKSLKFVSIFVIAALFCGPLAAKEENNLKDFLKELTISTTQGVRTQSAVWLPYQFSESAINAGSKTKTNCLPLKPYLIFLVKCSADTNDSRTFLSWSQIQGRTSVKGASPESLKPLTLISADVRPLLEELKTAIIENGGSISNSHIIIFDINDSNDNILINSAKAGSLTLTLDAAGQFDKVQFTWHTPFNSAPEAMCPNCGKKIKSQWHYCPYCGNKL